MKTDDFEVKKTQIYHAADHIFCNPISRSSNFCAVRSPWVLYYRSPPHGHCFPTSGRHFQVSGVHFPVSDLLFGASSFKCLSSGFKCSELTDFWMDFARISNPLWIVCPMSGARGIPWQDPGRDGAQVRLWRAFRSTYNYINIYRYIELRHRDSGYSIQAEPRRRGIGF